MRGCRYLKYQIYSVDNKPVWFIFNLFFLGRISGRCVKVTQHSFDIELLCHDMAQKLCHAAGKKYW